MMRAVFVALATALMTVAACADDVTPQVQYWDLPTGSRIAYARYPSPQKNAVPVIFIHGGPGAYEAISSHIGINWFRKLNAQGFDVWYYDQIGGGLSARLSDPRQYTVQRHVADLDAIRKTVGASHFIGVGESWGATLLANYMAAHPGVVSKAAFVSPGWIDPSEGADTTQPPQLTPEFVDWLKVHHPDKVARYARLDAQLRRDVVGAHQGFPDSEMDPLLDDFVNTAVRDRTVHDPARARKHAMHGMGWWSCVMTGWDAIARSAAPQRKLTGDRTPVLVLRAESDYIAINAAQEYVRIFARAKFVAVAKAGHMIWLEQPKAYTETLEKFFVES